MFVHECCFTKLHLFALFFLVYEHILNNLCAMSTFVTMVKYTRVYLLLSPYLCFISLLYLDLYVLGDDALIG